MSMNERVEIIPDLPFYYKIPTYILQQLPPPNTIKGLFAYSFIFFAFSFLLRLIAGLLNVGVDKRIEQEQKEIRAKIIQKREKKTEEAMKLLQGLK
jgi:energy-converting hydrogenase Eha subunit H